MNVAKQVRLAEHTTFRIGGPASLYITIDDLAELPEAYALAKREGLPVYPLGGGSNVLAADGEIKKAIITLGGRSVTYEGQDHEIVVVADAGTSWDVLVEETTARDLWGLENLAGIPGTVGAAPVQNIGAYGSEVADTILWVDVYDPMKNVFMRLNNDACAFGYRDSRFKRDPGLLVMRVAFVLSKEPAPKLSYPDLRARTEAGVRLETPRDIAKEVRAIRARKFPDLSLYGTAGSFFKNPVISADTYATLVARYPGLPGYEVEAGIKIPIAWILDYVLALKGFAHGPVSLFSAQPLVLVSERGATARDVNALAEIVIARVQETVGITIEREVQTLQ